MKKVIYIIIRYSVLIEDSQAWARTDSDLDKYKEYLFSKCRLEQRLDLLKNITIPSILGQVDFIKNHEVKVFIISSQELPEKNQKELNELVSGYDWIFINYLPTKGVSITQPVLDDLKNYNEKLLFATLRLDDDDALAINFLEEFNKFFNEDNIGYAVSFGKGLCGFYDFNINQYRKIVDYYYPKIGLGLGYINLFDGEKFSSEIKTVFDAGGHAKVDKIVPTIINSKEVMYIRTMYEQSDSYTDERAFKLSKLPSINASIIKEKFNIPTFNEELYCSSN